jgi:hypothetical protein
VTNRLIGTLSKTDRKLIDPGLRPSALDKGDVLFEPGEDVVKVCFPLAGTIASLVVSMRDGGVSEAAMIGYEGAVGGVISAGEKPAFSRGIVHIGGPALFLDTDVLEEAKQISPTLRDHFARYADCLLAQVLQSVGCNAIHDADARLARWLLATQDRVGSDELPLTQDLIAQMLGVQRPYLTRIIGLLVDTGSIGIERRKVIVVDRDRLEKQACECYGYLRRHFDRLLPGVYPRHPVKD